MNIKQTILRDLDGIIADTNHGTRRFFRCWLDGSYNGEEHYRANCEYLRENQSSPKKLRAFVIAQFCQYIAADWNCSWGYAQSVVAGAFNPIQLEQLNDALIDDALDLIAE